MTAYSFSPATFADRFLGDKQPFLQANFVMKFSDAKMTAFMEGDPYSLAPSDLTVFGFATSIPASVINVLEMPYIGGFVTPVPGKIQPNSIDLIFFENNRFSCTKFFEKWRSKTVEAFPDDPNTPGNVTSDSSEFKLDIEISLLNNARQEKTKLIIKKAFPVAITAPEFSWQAVTELPSIQISLVYDYYEMHNMATEISVP